MSGLADIVWIVLGLVILTLTFLDILVTILHPASQSPLSERLQRIIWKVIHGLARLLPGQARAHLLSWTVPACIAALLLFWITALLVGFACLYAPSMVKPGAFSSSQGPLYWYDAFYFSGTCLATVGFGDIVPHWGILRGASVAEGLCGLLVIGAAITYILSVFPILPLVRILAITLNEETNGHVDAVPMVRRYLAVGSSEALAQRCREVATSIITLTEAHASHPVLYYAHPRHVEQSFLRTLIVTQRLIGLLRYGLRQADHRDLVLDPRVVGLEESFIVTLRRMGSSLHLNVPTQDHGDEDHQELARDYDRLVAALVESGLRQDDAVHAIERRRYLHFRLATDPYVQAYGHNSGYESADLWGTHAPLRGTTAPIPSEQDEDEA